MKQLTFTLDCHFHSRTFIGPDYVRFPVSRADLQRWLDIAKTIKDQGLYSVTAYDDRCRFLEKSIDEDEPLIPSLFQQEDSQVVITATHVHFRGYEKGSPISSEWDSSTLPLADIEQAFAI